jgi:hypothetical protein
MAYFKLKNIVCVCVCVCVCVWGGGGYIDYCNMMYMITLTFFLDSSNPCCNDYILH